MEWRCPGPCGPLVGGVALGRGEQERGWRAVHPIKMQCRCTPCPIVHLHPVQCWSAARAQPCVLTCTLNMYTCRCALWWEGNVVILHSIRNSPVRRGGSLALSATTQIQRVGCNLQRKRRTSCVVILTHSLHVNCESSFPKCTSLNNLENPVISLGEGCICIKGWGETLATRCIFGHKTALLTWSNVTRDFYGGLKF